MILYIALTLTGTELSLDLIFNDKEIRTDTGFGWSLIIVWMVNACLSIPILMYIVQRAKQILDYVLTFHFFHLLCVWRVSQHFPTGTAWWILQVVNVAIMTFGGEWACMHREMKPIMISSGTKKDSKKGGNTNSSGGGSSSTSNILQAEDEEELIRKNNKQPQQKRKTSDAAVHTEEDFEEEAKLDDQGSLLAAVGKAKKALMSGSSRSKQRSSKKYDLIPMKDIDNNNDDNSSNHE